MVRYHNPHSFAFGGNTPNRFGHITDLSLNVPRYDITRLGDFQQSFIAGPGTIEFRGVAEATDEVMSALRMWMTGGMSFAPVYQPEWLCLYCGSPQKLERTHCEKCGAPRSWILG